MNLEPIDTSTTELLPCPFCGGSAEFVPYKSDGLTLKCTALGCVQRNQRTLRYGIDSLRASMTKHWNTRAPQWQPIESAPKDGTEFQAFKQGIGQFTALILTSEHMDCQYEGGVHCAWDHEYVEDVSHWQPLPAPPEVTP
ncbi:DUF551 domain-containing protein [Stenotrophomonas sp. NPDC078853]|uniref:DUF551 domain-containing protein n=1 Tax=Stenotrophomonas sp. NPDC078853 TaxID=3364534 RepID=UPI00384DC452